MSRWCASWQGVGSPWGPHPGSKGCPGHQWYPTNGQGGSSARALATKTSGAPALASPKPAVAMIAAAAQRLTVFMQEPYLNGFGIEPGRIRQLHCAATSTELSFSSTGCSADTEPEPPPLHTFLRCIGNGAE